MRVYTEFIPRTSNSVYGLFRDLHLYCGLFLGPFLIVFAVSAILINHAVGRAGAMGVSTPTPVQIPEGIEKLDPAARVRAARGILDQLRLSGEMNSAGFNAKEKMLTIPVSRPGWEATVRVDLPRQEARVESRRTGLSGAVDWLHKMPGPHLANIRGNWLYTRVWSVLSDATVYLLLLITATGVYLWLVLRAERRAGLLLLAAGAISFFGTVYALTK